MRKRRGQNRGKINIRSIGRTGVAYKKKKEERKEQKKRKNRNKKQKRKHKKNRKRIRGK